MINIAVCDDDIIFLHQITATLKEFGDGQPWNVQTFLHASELLRAIEKQPNGFHLILLDINIDKDFGMMLPKRSENSMTT
jgi:DNA-binding LytR/AlgR family response regulator